MVIFKWLLNLLKCVIYHIIKDKKVCLRRVWIRLTTAYLLCAREFRQNNALALQFWCLSNALTLQVRALDASKSQRACIILSKFTRKVNTQLLIYKYGNFHCLFIFIKFSLVYQPMCYTSYKQQWLLSVDLKTILNRELHHCYSYNTKKKRKKKNLLKMILA